MESEADHGDEEEDKAESRTSSPEPAKETEKESQERSPASHTSSRSTGRFCRKQRLINDREVLALRVAGVSAIPAVLGVTRRRRDERVENEINIANARVEEGLPVGDVHNFLRSSAAAQRADERIMREGSLPLVRTSIMPGSKIGRASPVPSRSKSGSRSNRGASKRKGEDPDEQERDGHQDEGPVPVPSTGSQASTGPSEVLRGPH